MYNERDAIRNKWSSIATDFKNSGLTQAEFSRQNNLEPKQLSYWLRKFKKEEQSIIKPTEPSLQWMKIECEEVPQKKAASIRSSSAALTLKVGEVSIEIQKGFDSVLLTQVISTLRSIC